MTPQPKYCKPNTKGRCRFCGERDRTGQERCPTFQPRESASPKEPSPKLIAPLVRPRHHGKPRKIAAASKFTGLGDLLEAIFRRMGIKTAVEYITAKLGTGCGCNTRKKLLNRYVPFCGLRDTNCWHVARKQWRDLWTDTRTRWFARRKGKPTKVQRQR